MTTTQTDTLRTLYGTLSGRTTPEVVNALIADLGVLPKPRRRKKAKDGEFDLETYYDQYYSKMPTGFEPVASLARSANVLATLIGVREITEDEGRDPDKIQTLIRRGRSTIHAYEEQLSFKHERLNREGRYQSGFGEMSRRRYNKIYRLLQRLDIYVNDLVQQNLMFEMGRFAKTGFASRIPWELFSADPATAAFVAYYTANLGRRSLFTAGKQARALDTRSNQMLKQLLNREETQWCAVAAVLPRGDILARLSNDERCVLLDWTRKVLDDAAEGLRVAAEKNDIDRETMTVNRGNDSSTWNALAGGWNRARDFWLSLIFSLGAGFAFQEFLPGKVMRLMAADVVAWHHMIGGKADDNTLVWAALPAPWEVLRGEARCGLAEVEAACAAAGVNPEKSGWTAPRAWTQIDTWRPTPETVHGVTVGHPELAAFLRRVGVFSGKGLKAMTEEESETARQGWEDHVVRIEVPVPSGTA
jgi:hypothetical protein